MKAFEIHTFHSGRWKIDSVFDDRELAVLEARRINAGNGQLGVRVVEEEFDEQSRRTMMRTVFHSSNLGEGVQARRQRLQQAAAGGTALGASPPDAAEPIGIAGGGAIHLGAALVKLSVILALALAALLGIQGLTAAS